MPKMEMHDLSDLYVEELRDAYNMERQLLKALPKMAKKAATPELKSALEHHLDQTRGQVERLDRIFDELGERTKGKKCLGMQGVIEEGKELLKEPAEPEVKDAGLIGAAQRVEHYEIAVYGTLRTFAQRLGYNEAANALQQTLDEEGQADKKLTEIAESVVNPKAQEGDGDGQARRM